MKKSSPTPYAPRQERERERESMYDANSVSRAKSCKNV